MNQRIVIVGFMGCGKTAVAAELAARLECEMIDLDLFITEREGRTPAEIIIQDSEPAFRAIETRALKNVLDDSAARVIALGGGAWTIEANRMFVARHDCVSVWLDAPFDLCWQRISASESVRPMAPDRESAQRLFESRRASYQLGTLRIGVVDDYDPSAVAIEIQTRLSLLR
jgi:shikimate kinase